MSRSASNSIRDAPSHPLSDPRVPTDREGGAPGCKLAKIYESRDDSAQFLSGPCDTGRPRGVRIGRISPWRRLVGIRLPRESLAQEGDDVLASKLPIVPWETRGLGLRRFGLLLLSFSLANLLARFIATWIRGILDPRRDVDLSLLTGSDL